MDDAFECGRGDGHGDEACPICRNEDEELDPDFLARIEHAAAQPGRVMTAEEFSAWLDSL